MKGRKSTINGLCYVPIIEISKDDPDEHVQETANHAIQVQEEFQFAHAQELTASARQSTVESNQNMIQGQTVTQWEQVTTNTMTQVPTMGQAELAMYREIFRPGIRST